MIRLIVGKENESLNLERLVNAHEQCRESDVDAYNVRVTVKHDKKQ
jgi:hypothetical protein